MAKEEKKALVPKLRFPEFLHSLGWEPKPLSTFVSALDAGVSVNAGDRPATSVEIGVLKTSCVTNGVFELSENKVVLEPDEQERVTECVHGGTIIISRMNTPALVGANAYVENDVANIFLPDRLWAAKPAPGANLRFIAHILGSDRGRSALSELAAGSSGSMKNIAKSAVLELLITAPEPDEQQKIADCLSSLDALIAAQRRKVEALKTYKRGLMQQLFPREGETLPRLRFPEFRDAPEWTDKKLSGVIDLVSGLHLSPDEYSVSGEVPYFTGPSDFSNDVQCATKWTKASANIAREDDTLITVKGSGVGEVWYLELPLVAMGRQLMAVRAHHNCSSRFIFQVLLTKRSRFEDLAAGNLIPGLARGDILNLVTPIPEEDEQRRIAGCLSSLDDQIAVESQQLDALKSHKKGLMQQLFPSLEAVEA